jgi:hypothetical protein
MLKPSSTTDALHCVVHALAPSMSLEQVAAGVPSLELALEERSFLENNSMEMRGLCS